MNRKIYDEIKVKHVKLFDTHTMLITFTNNEKRLFDMYDLLDRDAFEPLESLANFKTGEVANGTVQWMNGEIDIAPQTLYQLSYEYDDSDIVTA